MRIIKFIQKILFGKPNFKGEILKFIDKLDFSKVEWIIINAEEIKVKIIEENE